MGKRNRRDPEKEIYWCSIVRKFEASGMSVRAFCAAEKLHESIFYAWRRELMEKAQAEMFAAAGMSPSKDNVVKLSTKRKGR
jgi:hypothetical protein